MTRLLLASLLMAQMASAACLTHGPFPTKRGAVLECVRQAKRHCRYCLRKAPGTVLCEPVVTRLTALCADPRALCQAVYVCTPDYCEGGTGCVPTAP